MKFEYNLDYKKIDFRSKPHLYNIGSGEQGVLLVEPYKSEILPHWKFKTPEIAKISAVKIYKMFLLYKLQNDFVGMDMARKYLQMGYTRSRRYANHKNGRKYDKNGKILPYNKDRYSNSKAVSAQIFLWYYKKTLKDKLYKSLKAKHINSSVS